MNHLGTMYATKRRRRNSKSVRVQPKEGQTKSNPSKRHRERLNAELDMLASLLPYEQSVLSKLDKLSILRLSVSYLRTKSYFQAVFHKERERQGNLHEIHRSTPRELLYPEILMEGDLILQALNGFLLILTCDGEVFYTSHTVETYLGFHQSDICHQSVYELVHSEDREELQRHLMWTSHYPNDRSANVTIQEAFLQENLQYLERNFTVRFRCLLDNTSGFMRLDIRGRIKVLHGQNHKTENPPLALFAVCTPFGPPSLLEMPQKDSMFKSKHKLDLTLVSMDQRGKQLLGYSDTEMSNKGVYDLVHFDDLAYVASAHQELLKTGASGLIAYRLISKEGKWQWLQTSARLVYKNSKPDFILCTHRPLMEEEGRDLLGKRTMDFKVTYLDGGLGALNDRSGLLSDSDFVLRCQRNRRYKSQIRDLITNCRPSSKRKSLTGSEPETTSVYTPPFGDLSPTNAMSAAAANVAVAAAAHAASVANTSPYHHHHPQIPGPNPAAAVYPYAAHVAENMGNGLSAAAYGMPQNLFTAAAAMDHNSRSFLAPENFLHYSRHALSTYYPDYHSAAGIAAQYPSNGFLDHRSHGRSSHHHNPFESPDKLYGCQLPSPGEIKYNGSCDSSNRSGLGVKSCCESYINPGSSAAGFMSAVSIQPLLGDSQSKLTSVSSGSTGDLSCHRNSLGFTLNSGSGNDCISITKHKPSLPSSLSSLTPNTSGGSPTSLGGEGATASTTPSTVTTSSTPSNIIGSAFTSASPNHSASPAIISSGSSERSSVLMWNRTNNNSSGLSTSNSSPLTSSASNKYSSSSSSSSLSSSSLSDNNHLHHHHPHLAHSHHNNKSSPVVSCKWNGSLANPKPLSPHHPNMASSPHSGKVPMSMSSYGSASLYATNEVNPIEGWSVENLGPWRSHLPTLG